MTLMMLHMASESTELAASEADSDPRRDLGSRLTQLRGARGWKQRELARRAQIDPGRLSKLERGIHRASVDELVRLSRALNAGLDEIVFGAAQTLEGKWQRLLRELASAGGPAALDCAARLVQALALSFGNGAAGGREEDGPR
jgi:transcriptional regulator with XRE-family HTH domain